MNNLVAILLATALAAHPVPGGAQSTDDQALEKRLEEAQERLEKAARDVAELSSQMTGRDELRNFEFFMPGGRRAMLGINLGGAEPNGGGVRVESVSPGGPAAEAGIKPGDVIVSMQSKPVTTGRELVRVMERIEPGEKVQLGVRRSGKPITIAVEARQFDRVFVAPAPGPAIAAVPALPPFADHGFEWDSHWLLEQWGDAEFVTLTPRLGRYFGAEKGVLVARAPEDGALSLADGDVIVSIGGREPQDGRHAMRILRSYEPGESVELRILRDRRAQTLRAKIPERRAPRMFRQRLAPPEAPEAPEPPPAPEAPAST